MEIILNQETVEKGALQKFNEEARNLIAQCERVQVVDSETFGRVGDLVKAGRVRLKAMDEARLEETRKPREYVAWINAKFKELTDPLDKALKAAGQRAAEWAEQEEARRREEERIAREKAEAEALARAQAEEEARRAAMKAAQEAAARASAARQDGQAELAERAERAKEAAEQAAQAHEAQADAVLESAAEMPKVDPTVRKVRGTYGATAGIRKKLKFRVFSLAALPADFEAAILRDENAQKYMRIAVEKYARAELEKIKPAAEAALEDQDRVLIEGLVFEYDKQFMAR